MALALYHYNSSVCSEKVRMVLNEKGETGWESHEVDLFTGGQFDPAYLKLNPKAVVPTLVDDGRVLTESTLIAEYLDDKFAVAAAEAGRPVRVRADAPLFEDVRRGPASGRGGAQLLGHVHGTAAQDAARQARDPSEPHHRPRTARPADRRLS